MDGVTSSSSWADFFQGGRAQRNLQKTKRLTCLSSAWAEMAWATMATTNYIYIYILLLNSYSSNNFRMIVVVEYCLKTSRLAPTRSTTPELDDIYNLQYKRRWTNSTSSTIWNQQNQYIGTDHVLILFFYCLERALFECHTRRPNAKICRGQKRDLPQLLTILNLRNRTNMWNIKMYK